MTPREIARLIRAAGREPVERDTFYNPIERDTFHKIIPHAAVR
jgi:2-iminoacetate synthase ThiH